MPRRCTNPWLGLHEGRRQRRWIDMPPACLNWGSLGLLARATLWTWKRDLETLLWIRRPSHAGRKANSKIRVGIDVHTYISEAHPVPGIRS